MTHHLMQMSHHLLRLTHCCYCWMTHRQLRRHPTMSHLHECRKETGRHHQQPLRTLSTALTFAVFNNNKPVFCLTGSP